MVAIARHPGTWAVIVWLAGLAPALALPGIIDLSPFTLRGSGAPLVVGAALVVAMVVVPHRWRGGIAAGVAAGAFAAWVVLTMHTGLHGTPYGYGGLQGDAARLSAQAERYTTTWHSADAIVPSSPGEYPPLFAWLIGRASVLVGTPAWQLVGISETLLMSAAFVVCFLLWLRLVRPWMALALTLAIFIVFMYPAKSYEVMGLDLMIPWALATFAPVPGGRLNWLLAGVLGGLQILLYQLFLIFAAIGIVGLIILTWRRTSSRRRFGLHVCGVVIVSLAVSSWYLFPYLSWGLQHGLQNMVVLYQSPAIVANPFPFLSPTLMGALTAVGAVGLVWYRRREWWAASLLCLTLGVYLYRFAAEILFISNGNTLLLVYTERAVTALLAAAGILSIARAAPAVGRRLSVAPPRGLATLGLSALALWVGTTAWYTWLPGRPTLSRPLLLPAPSDRYNSATSAFSQPLPDGSYPRYAPPSRLFARFPVDAIVGHVRAVLGSTAAPVTLSVSDELFAIQPWPGYIAVGADAAGGTTNWPARFFTLQRLSHIKNQRAFARASSATRFGPIDVFVLWNSGPYWTWRPRDHDGRVRFVPAQFSPEAFTVFRHLQKNLILVVRRHQSAA